MSTRTLSLSDSKLSRQCWVNKSKPNLHENEHEHVQRDEVDDKHVAAPRAHHVHVAERAERTPHNAASLDRLDPQEVGEHEREYGDALVIIGTGHRSRDISRN